MPRDRGLVFREVPPPTLQRGLVLASRGVGGPKAEGSDVLRLSTEIGLRALEAAVSPGGAPRGVVRLCREAGAVLGPELGDALSTKVRHDGADGLGRVLGDVKAGLLAPRARGGKGPPEDSAEVKYAEAYTVGIQAGANGQAWTLAPADARTICAAIGPALRAHATAPGGAAITGLELIGWIRRMSEDFRRQTEHEPQYWSGWSPRAFARWLNTRTTAKRTTAQPAARAKFGKEAR